MELLLLIPLGGLFAAMALSTWENIKRDRDLAEARRIQDDDRAHMLEQQRLQRELEYIHRADRTKRRPS